MQISLAIAGKERAEGSAPPGSTVCRCAIAIIGLQTECAVANAARTVAAGGGQEEVLRTMLKRLIDILVSATGLLICSPVFAVIWLLVRWRLGAPSLFTQVRPGLEGKPFRMYKFRTMTNQCDANGKLLPNEQRMTRLGNFLRSSSLDELPELWNVLKGDMSLVGPRPLLVEYLEYYTPEQRRRHDVRPGVTGWAQVNGRNAISWDQKLELDVWYVDNQSTWLDLYILWRTIGKVIQREGIRHEGSVCMPRFDEYVKSLREAR